MTRVQHNQKCKSPSQAGFALMSLFFKFRDSPLLSSLSDAAKDKHRRLIARSIKTNDSALLKLLLSRHGNELQEIINVPLKDFGKKISGV